METAVRMEWLGWSHFRFTSVDGKVILLNPFVNNPDSIVGVDDIGQVDLILVTNGHGDEIGQAVEIAQKTGARVAGGCFDMGTWFLEMGVPAAQVLRANAGDRILLDGITVRVITGAH